jgi:hypothetical protein
MGSDNEALTGVLFSQMSRIFTRTGSQIDTVVPVYHTNQVRFEIYQQRFDYKISS